VQDEWRKKNPHGNVDSQSKPTGTHVVDELDFFESTHVRKQVDRDLVERARIEPSGSDRAKF
jgi:hypothetical protein